MPTVPVIFVKFVRTMLFCIRSRMSDRVFGVSSERSIYVAAYVIIQLYH
jgi:hypothetical protein